MYAWAYLGVCVDAVMVHIGCCTILPNETERSSSKWPAGVFFNFFYFCKPSEGLSRIVLTCCSKTWEAFGTEGSDRHLLRRLIPLEVWPHHRRSNQDKAAQPNLVCKFYAVGLGGWGGGASSIQGIFFFFQHLVGFNVTRRCFGGDSVCRPVPCVGVRNSACHHFIQLEKRHTVLGLGFLFTSDT